MRLLATWTVWIEVRNNIVLAVNPIIVRPIFWSDLPPPIAVESIYMDVPIVLCREEVQVVVCGGHRFVRSRCKLVDVLAEQIFQISPNAAAIVVRKQ
jgi:hypothetical protein